MRNPSLQSSLIYFVDKGVFFLLGLTPMIRLLNMRYRHSSGEDKECSTLLLFANKCEEDILWRKQLDDLCLSSAQ